MQNVVFTALEGNYLLGSYICIRLIVTGNWIVEMWYIESGLRASYYQVFCSSWRLSSGSGIQGKTVAISIH